MSPLYHKPSDEKWASGRMLNPYTLCNRYSRNVRSCYIIVNILSFVRFFLELML